MFPLTRKFENHCLPRGDSWESLSRPRTSCKRMPVALADATSAIPQPRLTHLESWGDQLHYTTIQTKPSSEQYRGSKSTWAGLGCKPGLDPRQWTAVEVLYSRTRTNFNKGPWDNIRLHNPCVYVYVCVTPYNKLPDVRNCERGMRSTSSSKCFR